MNNNDFELLPKNKVELVKLELGSYGVNKIIQNEYQIGWKVRQIISIEHLKSVMILFERK